nr:MAG TPA: hypothetical protein [Microviridae sp.]
MKYYKFLKFIVMFELRIMNRRHVMFSFVFKPLD